MATKSTKISKEMPTDFVHFELFVAIDSLFHTPEQADRERNCRA
jgi:hypothetical protein